MYLPETDWESQTAVSDEPWEVCADADTFESTLLKITCVVAYGDDACVRRH
jgi:hypothetical protein